MQSSPLTPMLDCPSHMCLSPWRIFRTFSEQFVGSIWPCLVFSELLFQSVAAKKTNGNIFLATFAGKTFWKTRNFGKTNTSIHFETFRTSFFSEILGKNIKLKVTSKGIKTVEKKGGIDKFLLNSKNSKLNNETRKLKKILSSKIS